MTVAAVHVCVCDWTALGSHGTALAWWHRLKCSMCSRVHTSAWSCRFTQVLLPCMALLYLRAGQLVHRLSCMRNMHNMQCRARLEHQQQLLLTATGMHDICLAPVLHSTYSALFSCVPACPAAVGLWQWEAADQPALLPATAGCMHAVRGKVWAARLRC
jgi:hypothetical protein